jgi:hypothetical protein
LERASAVSVGGQRPHGLTCQYALELGITPLTKDEHRTTNLHRAKLGPHMASQLLTAAQAQTERRRVDEFATVDEARVLAMLNQQHRIL